MKPKQKIGPKQEKFLNMLENGEYKQCTHFLCEAPKDKPENKRYCCMGIACLSIGLKPEEKNKETRSNMNIYKFIEEIGAMPEKVIEELKFHGHSGGWNYEKADMSKMNDLDRLTFKEIAEKIRKNPQDFFKEPA